MAIRPRRSGEGYAVGTAAAVVEHPSVRSWQDGMRHSDLVLGRVLRIVTHPRVFDPPSTWNRDREFADAVRSAPSAVSIAPGPRHWQIFTELAGRAGVRGNLVPDAYLAVLAIESGSE